MIRLMTDTLSVLVLLFVAGCAVVPPQPPQCKGPLTPINWGTGTEAGAESVEARTWP